MKKVTNWENVSFTIASDYRKKILTNLENPKIPSNLSKELNINKAHISRALKELEGKNMIKCLTPDSNKGKLYIISGYGKSILKKIKKL